MEFVTPISLDQALGIYGRRCDRKPPKWNVIPFVIDYLPAFKAQFPNYDRADHVIMAQQCVRWAVMSDQAWEKVHLKAISKYPESKTLISGIGYAENAPDEVKEKLRRHSRNSTKLREASRMHWRAAGNRVNTWLFRCWIPYKAKRGKKFD